MVKDWKESIRCKQQFMVEDWKESIRRNGRAHGFLIGRLAKRNSAERTDIARALHHAATLLEQGHLPDSMVSLMNSIHRLDLGLYDAIIAYLLEEDS